MSELVGFVIKTFLVLLSLLVTYQFATLAFGGGKVSTAISDTSSLALNVQSNYGTQASFSSLNNNILVHLAPQSMISNNSLSNPWGGLVTGGVNPENPAQFFILNTNVPNDACSKFAMLTGSISVQINGGTTYGPSNKIESGQAIAECNASNTSNTIRFVFGR